MFADYLEINMHVQILPAFQLAKTSHAAGAGGGGKSAPRKKEREKWTAERRKEKKNREIKSN